ncbi:MAG TPA: NAD-dependent malic enzyme [Dehalococcoidia bacterium]
MATTVATTRAAGAPPRTNWEYLVTLRIEVPDRTGMLGQVTSAIGEAGGNIGPIDIVERKRNTIIRDITVALENMGAADALVDAVLAVPGVKVLQVMDPITKVHDGGKIEVAVRTPVLSESDLMAVYTPGVAHVCQDIHGNQSRVWEMTGKGSTIAIITDGSAVLGLGNIGPEAGLPVMEGKSLLLKELSGVNAWPLCLATQDPDEIIQVGKAVAPGFGAIMLEDISAPRCFYIEQQLDKLLDIPVFHDDQHGTAVVVLAGLLNALKVVDKRIQDLKVVVMGLGAAGIACARILLGAGVGQVVGVGRPGIVWDSLKDRADSSEAIYEYKAMNQARHGTLEDAMRGADVFIGVSGPRVIQPSHVQSMARDPIVFALANPEPEIRPEEAMAAGAKVCATGRSDAPNQINNMLCFPGLFRGALAVRATTVTHEMKAAAAEAIASAVTPNELAKGRVIPRPMNRAVVRRVAKAVAQAAIESGVARCKATNL